MRNQASVAPVLARWRDAFVMAFVVLLLARVAIAATLSPFGDEAFYWQESRRLAWGYSDLPPMTAWMIHVGEWVTGHGVFGMRWPFLVMGSVLPWLVVAFGRAAFDEKTGWQAGLLCLSLPLAGTLGVLALPDVPLTVASMLALWALLRAMDDNRMRHWCVLGVALALCWMTHYRAAMPMIAGLLLLVLTPRGRMQWRRPGLWCAMAIAAMGLVPLAVSNYQQRGAGIAFQVIERNPWVFNAESLIQPVEQAVACSPLLYAFLLWAAWCAWRRRGEGRPWDLIAISSLSFIVLYFVLGLFADDLRFRAHWPLPGYLPLLAALPVLLRERVAGAWWRRLAVTAFALAGACVVAGGVWLGLAASPRGASTLADLKAFPARFVGWRESGALADQLLRQKPTLLVADNFMLAAELDFQLDGRVPVYALDSALNTKHGRSPQLAVWRLDEASLRATHAGQPMLLAIDETALRIRERSAWLGQLCNHIVDPQPVQRLDLFEGRRRISFYRGTVPSGDMTPAIAPESCPIWHRSVDAYSR